MTEPTSARDNTALHAGGPESSPLWPTRRREEGQKIAELVTLTRSRLGDALARNDGQRSAIFSRALERLTGIAERMHSRDPAVLRDGTRFDEMSPTERIRRAHLVVDEYARRRGQRLDLDADGVREPPETPETRALSAADMHPAGAMHPAGMHGVNTCKKNALTSEVNVMVVSGDGRADESDSVTAGDDDVVDAELVDPPLAIDVASFFPIGSVQRQIAGPRPRNARRRS